MTSWALVLAAGSGRRFGAAKQYEPLGGRTVVEWSVASARGSCDGVVVVADDPDDPALAASKPDRVVVGGHTRSASVRAGLAAVPEGVAVVVVHDAARPGATPELFRRVIAAVVDGADAAVPGLPVADTLKSVELSPDSDAPARVIATVDRAGLVAVQTPQAFRRDALDAAHRDGGEATDDAGLIELAGGRVVVVEGEATAHKITTRTDLAVVRALIEEHEESR